ELLEKYPNARVIHVSPEEYTVLEKKLQQHGYRQSEVVPLQLAQSDVEEPVVLVEPEDDPQPADDCTQKVEQNTDDDSLRVMLEVTDDVLNSSGNGSGDGAAVLFVIVGTVVVIVWALYVFKYLYDVSLGDAPCGRWHELTVVSSSASVGDGQHARFDGLRYATGFRDGSLDVGIGFELGQTDILLSEVGVLELKGRYWLLGPMLRWRLSQEKNPSYFQMNFVAGSTEHDEVGLLAKASLGLLFGIGDSMQLGLNWGVLNIDLNEDQGIITERDQYHYLYGINVGFKF
ncbi:MAG: hypothetical protein OQK32_08525, partial [Gammaproteobacteria bacterium]|nr:hypothetical protein [Gammaproteobacteria bacterium]